MIRSILLASLLALGWIGQVQASVYNFAYTFADTGAVVRGKLGGSVESNGLVFDITNFISLTVNGVAVTDNPAVYSADTFIFGGPAKTPTAALDASHLDFALSPGVGTSLLFGVGDQLSQVITVNVAEDRNYGGSGNYTVFNASLYSSFITDVPEPASLALLSVGAVGCAAVRRRRG